MREKHRALLARHHERFHPIWGQLLKTGYQNSRFAHQARAARARAASARACTACVSGLAGWPRASHSPAEPASRRPPPHDPARP